jgi:hypothetical protein
MKFKPIVPDTLFGPDQKRMHELADELHALYDEASKFQLDTPGEPQNARQQEVESKIISKENEFNVLLPKDFHHQTYKIKIDHKKS